MDCIILDIDGTLWDTTPIVAKAWNRVLEKREDVAFRATADKLKALFGRPLPVIASMIFPELSKEDQTVLIDQCCEEEHRALEETPGQVFEGVVETIRELSKKLPVCIVSNCQAGYIELTMKSLGIEEYITDFECPGYTGLSKGENCKLVMERNGFTSAVYVGDTQGDCEAAAYAGIPFVFCEYGFGQPEHYDYKISKFSQLLSLMIGN